MDAEKYRPKTINLLDNDAYYFLDVRTIKEHKNKSIPSTDCIPVQELEQRIDELNKHRNKKIIVYCRSGNRSEIATKILNQNGVNLTLGLNYRRLSPAHGTAKDIKFKDIADISSYVACMEF